MPSSLYDFRDLDLLLKLDAEGDHEGWVETELLARTMGLNLNGDRQLRDTGIGPRLSWMRRYGMLERNSETGMWRLTPGAERVIRARLKAAQARSLEALPDGAMVEVMANVTHRYRFGDQMMAQMLRREFLFGTQPR
jgi:hypothetical protein